MAVSPVPCSSCGSLIEPGDRFCGVCGTPVPRLCVTCGTAIRPGHRFCVSCGTPVAEEAPADGGSPAVPAAMDLDGAAHPAPAVSVPATVDLLPEAQSVPPAEERRLVTALFCDLVGFTPLSERLDPEEVRDIQAQYFGAMRRQIERFGGIVEKYAGDAVLALFGARVAHEDDAERAVLCALGMQGAIEPVAVGTGRRWQVVPDIRVGVNTGEVVSGIWDTGSRQDVAVTGDAVNTAARLQGAAEPGEVLAGEETMRLTRRRIRYGERRELTLKGKMGTVPAYPALGLREAFGERWEEGPRVSPFIGRDREMVQLLDAWIRVQGGEGQLLMLVGEPGVGKSRLAAELLEKISSSTAVRIVRARCLSYGQEISLWLIADLLRALFGIREQEPLEEVRARLQAGISALLGESDSAARNEALDVLGEVLGLPAGGSMVAHAGAEVRRHALLRSLRLMLAALSERAPTVLVLEDLHWIDAASQEVLREVLSDVPGLRLLVVAAQRPGWIPPWAEWGWTERTTLRPLREEEAALLAGAVLGGGQPHPGVAGRPSEELEGYVAERAGGNPFFIEEMLRVLEETGGLEQRDGTMHLVPGAAERLPSTLTEVLLARLDRLEGPVRQAAQVGSVIGRSFPVRLLAEVMEQEQEALELPLVALQQAEIAFPRRGTDREYVFKHVSMRDVAYNTLVQKRRQELHLRTAQALAASYPSDEYAEMIAYHYSKTEAPEAAVWLERAGDRAAAIYAVENALTHYGEARQRLLQREADPLAITRLEEKLGGVLIVAGRYDEALEVLSRVVESYRAARDLEAAGRVTALMGMAHRYRGSSEEGIALVLPMVDLLSWSGPSHALASLQIALANLYFLLGRYREQLAAAERAVEIARAIGDTRLLGDAEERRGSGLIILGQPEEGHRVLEAAIPLIEEGGDLFVLWRALNNLGEAHKQAGNFEASRRATGRGVEVTERIGNLDQRAFILANLGNILTVLGEWEDAEEQLERSMDLARRSGQSAAVLTPAVCLGQLMLWKGRWQTAVRFLEQSMALAEETGDRQAREGIRSSLAELDILQGRPAEAIGRLEPLAADQDTLLVVRPVFAWALLEAGAGTVARAEEVAADALRRAREGRQRIDLVDALRVLGMVLARQGRAEEAREAYEEGVELARALPYPYAEARILEQMAALDAARGGTDRGRARLEEALAIFGRLGAAKDMERVEELLAVGQR